MTATEPVEAPLTAPAPTCTCGVPDEFHWPSCALVPAEAAHAPACRVWPCTCHLNTDTEGTDPR
jgi:hypothetical protein